MLAWTSFSFAKGQPSSSKAQSADFTATLLQHTGGRLFVAVIGVVALGIAAYGLYSLAHSRRARI